MRGRKEWRKTKSSRSEFETWPGMTMTERMVKMTRKTGHYEQGNSTNTHHLFPSSWQPLLPMWCPAAERCTAAPHQTPWRVNRAECQLSDITADTTSCSGWVCPVLSCICTSHWVEIHRLVCSWISQGLTLCDQLSSSVQAGPKWLFRSDFPSCSESPEIWHVYSFCVKKCPCGFFFSRMQKHLDKFVSNSTPPPPPPRPLCPSPNNIEFW